MPGLQGAGVVGLHGIERLGHTGLVAAFHGHRHHIGQAEACTARRCCHIRQLLQAAPPITTTATPVMGVPHLFQKCLIWIVALVLRGRDALRCKRFKPEIAGPIGHLRQRLLHLGALSIAQRFDGHQALRQLVGTEDQRKARARIRRPS